MLSRKYIFVASGLQRVLIFSFTLFRYYYTIHLDSTELSLMKSRRYIHVYAKDKKCSRGEQSNGKARFSSLILLAFTVHLKNAQWVWQKTPRFT